MAAVAAQGATALAEGAGDSDKGGPASWRWQVFATGMGIGLLFGGIYVGLPALTGLIASRPLELLPIPWIDFTRDLEHLLPATPLGVSTDLGLVLAGFVLPFWVVVGAFSAAVLQMALNPVFHAAGILTRWHPGMDAVTTHFVNDLDLWLSVYLGTAAAVALAGIGAAVSALRRRGTGPGAIGTPPAGRGDFPIWIAVALYCAAAAGYTGLCVWLLVLAPYILVQLVRSRLVLRACLSRRGDGLSGLRFVHCGI